MYRFSGRVCCYILFGGRKSVGRTLWEKCLSCLQDEFPSQQFNTWIRPLQVEHVDNKIILFAPNRFVLDWINERFLSRIRELITKFCDSPLPPAIFLEIGSKTGAATTKQ